MHIPNRHDATNWYRGTGPLSHLKKSSKLDLKFSFANEISFATAQLHDLAFFQRPSTSSELEAIRIFKRLGIPVIVDYDDLFFEIPTDNPAHQSYMNRTTQETIVQIMREADCVWVSTKEIKRCVQLPNASLNERVYVVPNALDDIHLVMRDRSKPQTNRQPAVMWRGSPTHERDVMEFTPEIGAVAKGFPNWSFVFAGWNPWFLTDGMAPKQALCSGALPVGEFMDFVYATGAEVGMVPLHDSRFNRCKSNIAWLEMTWGGAAVLAPDWEEWRHPGVTTYLTQEDYRIGLASLIEMGSEKRRALNQMSWEHIKNNFMLSKVNYIRERTIRSLVNGSDWYTGYEPLQDDDVMDLA
jgi:hypothetical protein